MIIDIPKIGEVEFPDSMSEKEVNLAAKKLYDQANAPTKLTAGEVASQAITNLPSSFGNLVGNLATAITSPLETGKAVLDVGAGALQNILPEKLVQAIGEDKPSREIANQVGQFYVNRYGSVEGAKKAIAEDPAGVLADISTVLSGGAMIAPKVVAPTLSRVASTIDPLSAAVKATGTIANVAGKNIIAPALGVTTGAGRESIAQAFKAGQKGGATAEQFRANISGKVDPTEVLDIAKSNLDELNRLKQSEYRSGMVNIKNDKSILDFGDVDNALKNATNKVTFKGEIVNKTAAEKLQEAKDIVNKWKNLDPAEFHTPEGLDALKKQVGDVLEGIPFEQKVARSSIGDIYSSLKTTIQKQAPTYAKTMKAYSEASDQIKEIERALSLGKKASVDTATRKLQSLMRDNVQTNYGQRTKLAKELESIGGQEFMPGLAGQALSSAIPKGLQGVASLPTSYLAYGAGGIPAALGNFALSSPRAVGEATYAAGLTSRGARKFGEIVPPAVDPRTYNLLLQSGRIKSLLEE